MPEAPAKSPVKSDRTVAAARQRNWPGSFENLRHEIDRLFDDFHPFGFRLPSDRSAAGGELSSPFEGGWPVAPAMDLVEGADAYEITAELPGIDEKNVEINLANHVLTIKGEKKEQTEQTDKNYHLTERRFGSFQRSFQLPEGVDTDKIDASFSKGVLTVKLPKTVEARKAEKKITVKGA